MIKICMQFLKEIKYNNNREWFLANKDLYLEARSEFENLVAKVIEGIGKFDPQIATLEAKNCLYRQYRDVRFSKDKTPYKVHMGAYINVGGKKVNTPGYYIHLEPNNKSIFGGGYWEPQKDELKKVRQEIDYNLPEWEKLINSKKIKSSYPSGLSEEGSLKSKPAGYDVENPAIKFLKLKSFILSHSFTDKEVEEKSFSKDILKHAANLKPVLDFLNKALD